jgi:hypothetical protein
MSTESDGRMSGNREMMVQVVGLAVACPFTQDNPEHCQLCEIRCLPMGARIEWARGLSGDELLQIAADHKRCVEALKCLASDTDETRS